MEQAKIYFFMFTINNFLSMKTVKISMYLAMAGVFSLLVIFWPSKRSFVRYKSKHFFKKTNIKILAHNLSMIIHGIYWKFLSANFDDITAAVKYRYLTARTI